MNRLSISLWPTLFGALLALACAEPPPQGPPQTLFSHPRALDRYARLRMRELVDPDPVAAHQQVACEMHRVFAALGGPEGELRMTSADDSIHRSPEARARFAEVQEKLFGNAFEAGGRMCDSLNATADREEPIVPADPALRNQP